ncbi:MAG TPA: hypothetical protein VJ300_06410 [Thermoplasmata archaeon]|nr:hypothetical protein [Thermoplasmata archaeon]
MRRGRSDLMRERIRWLAEAYAGWIPTCPPCGEFIDACACVCSFCGESQGCRCVIGFGVATGG